MSVRPSASVRLSVTRWYFVEMAKHVIKLFTSGRDIFSYQTLWQYSDRETPNGSSNARGHEKIAIFDQYLAISHNHEILR